MLVVAFKAWDQMGILKPSHHYLLDATDPNDCSITARFDVLCEGARNTYLTLSQNIAHKCIEKHYHTRTHSH